MSAKEEVGAGLEAGWIEPSVRSGGSRQDIAWLVSQGSLCLGGGKLLTVGKGFLPSVPPESTVADPPRGTPLA